MTKRIQAAANNAAVNFDGLEGVVARAEIFETTPQGSGVRSVDLMLRGPSEDIGKKALAALNTGRHVRVRVLGFEASWQISAANIGDAGLEIRLKSTGAVTKVAT